MEEMIINIISLPKRQDRREAVKKQMAHEKCAYQFWDGVEGKVAKTAISQAHKKVVREAQRINLEYCCVAEDDLEFTGTGAWQYFLSNMPKSFDLYVGSYYSGSHDENFVVSGFRGLTLYIINSSFYQNFLSLPETMHIDGALAVSGAKIVVSPLFVCRQAPGYSDQRRRHAENNIIGKQLFGDVQDN
jgi:hypothetical protein